MAKIKNELTLVPIIKIHPSKIITYNEIHWHPFKPEKYKYKEPADYLVQVETEDGIKLKRVSQSFIKSSRKSTGELSKQAKKKLKLAIEYFLLLNRPSNGKTGNTGRHFENNITFITLTLPSKQQHTDKEIKEKCLNQFLIELARYDKISMYVWRAEYQKNGNIHFHILANSFIPWARVRNRWNRIIEKLGYISAYGKEQKEFHKDGFKLRKELLKKWTAEKQLKAYERGKRLNWRDPNSTDIHSIKNITDIKKYLTKYLSKNEQSGLDKKEEKEEKRKEIGRIWSASMVLMNISGAYTQIDSSIEKVLEYLQKYFPDRIYQDRYFSVIDFSIDELSSFKCLELRNLFDRYLLTAFGYNTQLSF